MGYRAATSLCVLAIGAALAGEPASACTTFCSATQDGVLFGRNYDFEIGNGDLMLNTRGLEKHGLAAKGPTWTTAYGSVTFNQFGRDFPMGGMNEKGLVVELMWLSGTEYPAADARSELGVLEWIQYQLDTAATVSEVLQSDARVRIAGSVPLHYLISDRSGAVATVEFLDHRLVSHSGSTLPVAALTNSTYDKSVRYWHGQGESSRPPGAESEARFARTATQVNELKGLAGQVAVDRAFAILDDVAQPATRWSIVYDQTARIVHFRTARNPAIRTLKLAAQELSCRGPVRLVDIDLGPAGDVSARLQAYTDAANESLVRGSYASCSLTRGASESDIRSVVSHPARDTCRLR
ncbi:MAG: linear amide C-N hydrolase [Acidobacteriota bacterium]